MRPSLQYLTQQFDRFNAQCFGETLPPIALRINHARSRLGSFAFSRTGNRPCQITISDAFDLAEATVDDTIIHEMIHYFLFVNGLSDATPHGPNFRAKMAEINATHGRNITIRGHLDSPTRESSARRRHNYICLTTWADGTRGISVCGRGSIGRIHRAFSLSSAIRSIRWYYSSDPWFSRYPLLRTPKAHPLPQDFPADLLTPIH